MEKAEDMFPADDRFYYPKKDQPNISTFGGRTFQQVRIGAELAFSRTSWQDRILILLRVSDGLEFTWTNITVG